MSGERIDVKIGAEISGLTTGLRQATGVVKSATSEMEGTIKGLGSAFSNLSAPIMAFTALLGGGALFKSAIDKTMEYTLGVSKLARALGVTTEEASAIKEAIDKLGVAQDTYTKGVLMMTRQLNTGGQGLKALGVQTKDAAGHFRPANDLMMETLSRLNGLKAGTDRNAAGLAIFGRSWGEVSPLLRLSTERLEEARKEVERLGLVVGKDGVSQARAYKEAMHDVSQVFEAVKIRIGTVLLPILTDLANWFSKIGPGAVAAAGVGIKSVILVVVGLTAVVRTLYEWLVTAFGASAVEVFVTLGRVISKVMKGDFKGAVDEAKRGAEEIEGAFTAAAVHTAQIWSDFGKTAMDLKYGKPKATGAPEPETKPEGTFDPEAGKDTSKKLFETWKQDLQAIKDLEENWFTWSEDKEIAFWQAKLAETKKGSDAYREVMAQIASARKAIAQRDHDTRLAEMKAQQDEYNNDLVRDLEVQRGILAEEVRIHGEGSKEVIAARKQLVKIERDIAAERQALRTQEADFERDWQLGQIDEETANLARRRELGEISARQELEALQELERAKYAAQKAALDAALDNDKLTSEQRQGLINQELLLWQQYRAQVGALQGQIAQDQVGKFQDLIRPLADGFNNALQSMLAGTMRFSTALRQVWLGIGQMIDRLIIETVQKWIVGELRKLAQTKIVQAMLVALHLQTSSKQKAIGASTATTEITQAAGVAGAKAGASAAAIPVAGWAMAIPIALGVIAAVLAFKSMASAAGGWDIPGGMNPIAQLHQREMVLPASLADRVRNMTDGAGEGMTIHAPMTLQFLDAAGAEDVISRNKGAIFKHIEQAVRDGRLAMKRT